MAGCNGCARAAVCCGVAARPVSRVLCFLRRSVDAWLWQCREPPAFWHITVMPARLMIGCGRSTATCCAGNSSCASATCHRVCTSRPQATVCLVVARARAAPECTWPARTHDKRAWARARPVAGLLRTGCLGLCASHEPNSQAAHGSCMGASAGPLNRRVCQCAASNGEMDHGDGSHCQTAGVVGCVRVCRGAGHTLACARSALVGRCRLVLEHLLLPRGPSVVAAWPTRFGPPTVGGAAASACPAPHDSRSASARQAVGGGWRAAY